jgi:hypothetical protein
VVTTHGLRDGEETRVKDRLDSATIARAAVLGAIMTVIFAVSVFVRAPYMGRPLAGHHEFLTSTMMRTLDIWYEDGAIDNRFLPVFTYPGEANRNINNHATQADDEGRYYYTSFGPVGFIAPYLTFRALGAEPSIIGLQSFNLAVHFLTALVLFLIVVKVTRPKDPLEYLPAFVAFFAYTFATTALWFHSNVYYSEMLVQLFFAAGVYLVLLYIERPASRWLPVTLALVTFLMVWTEWLGVFFAVAVGAYALWHIKSKPMGRLLASVSGGAVLGGLAYALHYSLISGFSGLWETATAKYAMRSGFGERSNFSPLDVDAWGRLARAYDAGYSEFLVALAVLAVVALVFSLLAKDAPRSMARRRVVAGLVFVGGPVVLHHLVLFDHTVTHDFTLLKSGLFIGFVAALAAMDLIRRLRTITSSGPVWFASAVIAAAFLAAGYLSATVTYIGQEGRWATDLYQVMGDYIAENSMPDEVVFIDTHGQRWSPKPQVVVYAGRNIASWSSAESADKLLERNGTEKAVIFNINPDSSFTVEPYRLGDGRGED